MLLNTIVSTLTSQTLEHPLRTFSISLLLVPIIYIIINEFIRKSARIPGFSGPPGLPLIGNLHEIRINAAEQYRKWSKVYGDVYQIQLGNVPILVVNSAQAAKVIFGNNSQVLSSRPVFWTFHKVCFSHSLFLPSALLTSLQATRTSLTAMIDPLQHSRHNNRHIPLQRIPQKAPQGRRLGSQQTLHPNLHPLPRH